MSETTPTARFQVNCAYVQLVDPMTLKPHPENPNTHPPKQIELFVKILDFNGWRRPITVSKRSGFITKGHGALEAALSENAETVPVDFQDYESDAHELADVVADNELARLAIRDEDALRNLLAKINTGAIDLETTGLDKNALEKFLANAESPPAITFGESPPLNASGPDAGASPSLDAAPASSHVRMVQLFLNTQTLPEFEELVSHFQTKLGTQNATDTVMEALRRARAEDRPSDQATPEGKLE